MKIIKLEAENIKRLKAVEITPEGNLVVIGGKNAQGKTSVLDSIQYALGGESGDKAPVRRGEARGTIVVDLGDIVVKRVFTATGGGSLVVANADGVAQKAPQALLDGIAGKLTFDPLAFSRQKPKEQADTLRALVGLNFDGLDRERALAFDVRTGVNRNVKALEAQLAVSPKHEGVPDAEVSIADIVAMQEKAAARNRANEQDRAKAAVARQGANELARQETALRQQIEDLQKQLKTLSETAEAQRVEAKARTDCACGLGDVDLAPFRAQAAEAEATNAKVRKNAERAELVKRFKAAQEQAEALTKQIEACDAKKRDETNKAKWPIEGLGFDTAGGVTLNALPLENASSAEQLQVSVAIGLALNPKLKVLLIRDGSLLDNDSLAAVAGMAAKADAQVWIERVGKDDKTSVVIEDGEVA